MRSFTIGPPIVVEKSYTFVSGVGATKPCDFSDGVRLSDWSCSPVPLAKSDARVVLPPGLGTMFITSPAVSDSPDGPEENVTSWALPTSTT